MENTSKKNHTLRNILLIGILGILGACAFLVVIGVAYQAGTVSQIISPTTAPLAAIPTLAPVKVQAQAPTLALPTLTVATQVPTQAPTLIPVVDTSREQMTKEANYLLAELDAATDYQNCLRDLSGLFKAVGANPYVTTSDPLFPTILNKSADLVNAARRMAMEPIPSPKYAHLKSIMAQVYTETLDYQTHIKAGLKTLDVDEITQATQAILRVTDLAQQATDEITRLK